MIKKQKKAVGLLIGGIIVIASIIGIVVGTRLHNGASKEPKVNTHTYKITNKKDFKEDAYNRRWLYAKDKEIPAGIISDKLLLNGTIDFKYALEGKTVLDNNVEFVFKNTPFPIYGSDVNASGLLTFSSEDNPKIQFRAFFNIYITDPQSKKILLFGCIHKDEQILGYVSMIDSINLDLIYI